VRIAGEDLEAPLAEIHGERSGIVPGFDATWHGLDAVRAGVDGPRATTSAQVDGRHWLDGSLGRAIGRYDWS
jgi:hypothetical protein